VIGVTRQHIANIDYKFIRLSNRIDPFAIVVLHLESASLCAHQQSNQVDVAMGCSPDRSISWFISDRRIMNRAEDTVSVFDFIIEIIFVESEVKRQRTQYLHTGFLQHFVRFAPDFIEFRKFFNLNVCRIFCLEFRIVFHVLPEMPELFQVASRTAFRVFLSKRNVAALATNSRDFVLEFRFERKVKEVTHFFIQFVYKLVINKMTLKRNKANVFVSFTDFIYKFLLAFRVARKEITQIHTWNVLHTILFS